MASSALVTITDELELKLIEILKDNSNDSISEEVLSECESHIANADASKLIGRILKEENAVKSLITMEPRNDCVSAFSIFVNLLNKVGVEEEAMELTRDV